MKSMISSDKKLANAVGGKSARPCDNCIKKRARWYCAADDAFLCQSCDSTVHSANPLAKRHKRVRFKSASIKSFDDETLSEKKQNTTKLNPNGSKTSVPTWHRGFTRKTRTPRHKKTNEPFFNKNNNPFHLVPENYSKENSLDDNEEQLLYRVPIFDPFVSELCYSNEAVNNMQNFGHESKKLSNEFSQEINHLHDFLPSEMDLAEFTADVENLLGKGLEDDSFDMESLGLLDTNDCSLGTERVKNEDEGIGNQEIEGELIDMGRETFELNFDYDSPINCDDEDIKIEIGEPVMMIIMNNFGNRVDGDLKKKMFLRLDYEGVMSAWDSEKSPWTTGERPDLDSGVCICSPNCMGTCGTVHLYGDMGMIHGHSAAMADRGREARVSRYREKRRTRLFSKKIRYEVRKLNAEKRPRMKGRFVKRANLVTPLLKK